MSMIAGSVTVDMGTVDGSYTVTPNSLAEAWMNALYPAMVTQVANTGYTPDDPTKYNIALGAAAMVNALVAIVPYMQTYAEVPLTGVNAVCTTQSMGTLPNPPTAGSNLVAPGSGSPVSLPVTHSGPVLIQ